MNYFGKISLCFLFGCMVTLHSQAGVIATNISASPTLSTNGYFTVFWSFSEPGPDESCMYFEVEVSKIDGGYNDYYVTDDCNEKMFSATGYPDGVYQIVIGTNVLIEDISGGWHQDIEYSSPIRVTVDRGATNISGLDQGFESNLGSWANTGSFDWIRKTGSTPSGSTGPVGAAQGAYYVYVETSGGHAYYSGNTAILESPTFNLTGEDLHFKYHMYGSNMGSLNLELYNDGDWHTLWSNIGQVQTAYQSPWEDVWVSLAGFSGAGKLRFRGVAAGGYMGDMSIDDIWVRPAAAIVTKYSYDELGRVRLVTENGKTRENYKYDKAGNFCEVSGEGYVEEGYCEE